MSVEAKQFNWFRSPSVWEYAQLWRARRRAAIEEYLATLETSSAVAPGPQAEFFPGTGSNTAREIIDQAQVRRSLVRASGTKHVDLVA